VKKGSLSLSVNAIVIFVLAFAMLGFGLFIIQKLQGQTDSWTDKAFDMDDFSTPPSSKNPIVFSESLSFKPTGGKPMGVAVYNSGGTELSSVKPVFVACTGGLTFGSTGEISIDTLAKNSILTSESFVFKANIVTNGAEAGDYVCEIGFGTNGVSSISQQFNVVIKN